MTDLRKIVSHLMVALALLAPIAQAGVASELLVDTHHSIHCDSFCAVDEQVDTILCDQCLGHAPIPALPLILFPGHDTFFVINGFHTPSIQLDRHLPPPKFV